MSVDDLALLSRRERLRLAALVAILIAVAVWASLALVQPGPPRRIVMASGPESGVYHRYARRYVELLAREGVTVEERMTGGAAENLRLLADPKSGVDIALLQAGLATSPAADGLVMLASLYYEPLWIFYRGPATLTKINELHGKRMAAGVAGSGTRALVDQMLAANGLLLSDGVPRDNTEITAIGGNDAVDALKSGAVDAALFVGGAQTPAIQRALRDPAIRFMSLSDAAAYQRRFSYLTKLTLPAGAIDLAINLPDKDVEMIGTQAMLAARDDIHPALINMLIDAAREIHSAQGYFEAAGEFPGTAPLDLRVSPHADQHKRFGPSFLYRYLPFWLATLRRAGGHPADPARRRAGPAAQLPAAVPPLARPLAHLPVVRRARAAGTRRRDAAGGAAGGDVVARHRPHRACGGEHSYAGQLWQRGVHAARAHRPRAAKDPRAGGRRARAGGPRRKRSRQTRPEPASDRRYSRGGGG